MIKWEHNPGSKAAEDKGCTCPVLENARGLGVDRGKGVTFRISGDCPLHAKTKKTSA